MHRQGILEKDTDTLIVYTHDYYTDCDNPTQYTKYQQNELAKHIGLTLKSLIEYISRKRKVEGVELHKLTKSGDMIRLL